jgi:Prohead core protein serine protease
MKLLTEVNDSVKVITEGKDGARKYFLEGIFIQGDLVNRNGRKYPIDTLAEEVERYSKEHIDTNRAYGELGHPDTPTIQLDRVSHMIRSLVREGKNFIGKAEILGTPNGNIVKALIDAGATLGVSSRGVGTLKQEGTTNIVQPDFRLMTAADIVADPSAPDAFVTAVMEEKEWVWNNGKLMEKKIAGYKKKISNVTSKDLMEEKLRIFEDFLSKI